ncbi:hypothetical protein [Nostoc sp. LPT]|uniref:hypothetical protein n=1 Tax=Nostoc sp. LPT TaxID=2815387 RepID=UPI001D6B1687|nr:hypothetical protein [Nostoc sp. LPT]MBN4006820.1 hypothetical protein [Nostoc sp. LPT]
MDDELAIANSSCDVRIINHNNRNATPQKLRFSSPPEKRGGVGGGVLYIMGDLADMISTTKNNILNPKP